MSKLLAIKQPSGTVCLLDRDYAEEKGRPLDGESIVWSGEASTAQEAIEQIARLHPTFEDRSWLIGGSARPLPANVIPIRPKKPDPDAVDASLAPAPMPVEEEADEVAVPMPPAVEVQEKIAAREAAEVELPEVRILRFKRQPPPPKPIPGRKKK